MSKLLVVALVAICPSLASAQACNSLEVASWMLGHWETEAGGTETWSRVSDDTYEGQGFDGRSHESLRLVEMADGVFYIAKVAHNDLPIPFKLTGCTEDTLVFENPTHDFPQRLEYRRDGEAMQVRVSDGGARGFGLMFHRHSR